MIGTIGVGAEKAVVYSLLLMGELDGAPGDAAPDDADDGRQDEVGHEG